MRALLLCLLIAAAPASAGPVCDAVWHDSARNRDVPVRVRLPDGAGRVPVVLYSHGLGGDLGGGTIWGEAWAKGGIATIHIQHPGSDTSLWAGATNPAEAVERMKPGMAPEQFFARIADIRFVLDSIPAHPKEGACDLTRLDTARAGVAGHSFGAVTTQAVAGQRFFGEPRFRDDRFKAAIAFSPSAPSRGTAAEAFGGVTLPFLMLTGTEDAVPELTSQTAASRTEPFAALPPGQKYLLVFDGADHLVFGGHRMRRTPRPADAHVHDVAAAASTAFWQATLAGDARAKAWLAAPTGLKAMLAPGDRLEAK
jgi:predicted dienelactone hydrolase